MAASRSLEEKETLRSVVFESAHPAELVAGHTLELRAQIQKGWTDEQFKISVESQRGPIRRLKWLAVSTSVRPLASHRIHFHKLSLRYTKNHPPLRLNNHRTGRPEI
jgi:hypothetical protein